MLPVMVLEFQNSSKSAKVRRTEISAVLDRLKVPRRSTQIDAIFPPGVRHRG